MFNVTQPCDETQTESSETAPTTQSEDREEERKDEEEKEEEPVKVEEPKVCNMKIFAFVDPPRGQVNKICSVRNCYPNLFSSERE